MNVLQKRAWWIISQHPLNIILTIFNFLPHTFVSIPHVLWRLMVKNAFQ